MNEVDKPDAPKPIVFANPRGRADPACPRGVVHIKMPEPTPSQACHLELMFLDHGAPYTGGVIGAPRTAEDLAAEKRWNEDRDKIYQEKWLAIIKKHSCQAEYIKQSQLRLKKLRAERDKLDAKMTQERAIIAALKA